MLRKIVIGVALLVILVGGCSPTEPDTTDFPKAASLANEVIGANAMTWIEQLTAVRAQDTPVNCDGFAPDDDFPACNLTRDAAVNLVSQAFSAMGYAPQIVTLGTGPQASYQIVAEWPGTSSAQGVILVAAHHDAFFGGADDNNSAVAAMLETARVVRAHQFAKTIRFVAFDLEEFGSVGSTRYVEAGLADDVTAAIVLDMVGFASHEPSSQDPIPAVTLPDVGDFLLVVGNQDSATLTQQMTALGNSFGLAKLFGVIAAGDGTYFLSSTFMRSDHGLLWFRGIPAIFLTDTANFRNPHYHKPTDTPETLDPTFLAANTRALAAAVALFAEVQ